jgi:hypothetical protein
MNCNYKVDAHQNAILKVNCCMTTHRESLKDKMAFCCLHGQGAGNATNTICGFYETFLRL